MAWELLSISREPIEIVGHDSCYPRGAGILPVLYQSISHATFASAMQLKIEKILARTWKMNYPFIIG